MCDGPKSQQNLGTAQSNFYNLLSGTYQTEFGEDQNLFNTAMSIFEPIAEAGPDQQQPAAVTAAERTQADESASSDAAQASSAVNNELASRGGDNFEPSGATGQLFSQIATGAEKERASEQQQITQNSYAVGRSNWLAATQGMLEAPSVFSSANSAAGEATGAGSAASTTQDELAQEQNSWLGVVGGLAGTAAGGWASGGFKLPS